MLYLLTFCCCYGGFSFGVSLCFRNVAWSTVTLNCSHTRVTWGVYLARSNNVCVLANCLKHTPMFQSKLTEVETCPLGICALCFISSLRWDIFLRSRSGMVAQLKHAMLVCVCECECVLVALHWACDSIFLGTFRISRKLWHHWIALYLCLYCYICKTPWPYSTSVNKWQSNFINLLLKLDNGMQMLYL